MKNIFNNKSSFKFNFQTKSSINFSNSYFLFTVRNLINLSKSASSIQISKLILGSTKNIGEELDEISYTQLDSMGSAMSTINEFALISKSKIKFIKFFFIN